jgi:hypothetical protein
MTEKPQKTIQVLSKPATYITIDADVDETEAKRKWLKKYFDRKSAFLSDEQKRREFQTIRQGKTMQRTRYR